MANLTFSKIIFAILIIGVVFTGFIKLGVEVQSNSNIDTATSTYLSNINTSIQGIESIDMNETSIDLGEEDSFSKQYKEAKLYATTASGLLSTAGDTPDILIKTLDVEDDNNSWFINYITVGVKIVLFLVILFMLFGRRF